jgi:hypothetical protein
MQTNNWDLISKLPYLLSQSGLGSSLNNQTTNNQNINQSTQPLSDSDSSAQPFAVQPAQPAQTAQTSSTNGWDKVKEIAPQLLMLWGAANKNVRGPVGTALMNYKAMKDERERQKAEEQRYNEEVKRKQEEATYKRQQDELMNTWKIKQIQAEIENMSRERQNGGGKQQKIPSFAEKMDNEYADYLKSNPVKYDTKGNKVSSPPDKIGYIRTTYGEDAARKYKAEMSGNQDELSLSTDMSKLGRSSYRSNPNYSPKEWDQVDKDIRDKRSIKSVISDIMARWEKGEKFESGYLYALGSRMFPNSSNPIADLKTYYKTKIKGSKEETYAETKNKKNKKPS